MRRGRAWARANVRKGTSANQLIQPQASGKKQSQRSRPLPSAGSRQGLVGAAGGVLSGAAIGCGKVVLRWMTPFMRGPSMVANGTIVKIGDSIQARNDFSARGGPSVTQRVSAITHGPASCPV